MGPICNVRTRPAQCLRLVGALVWLSASAGGSVGAHQLCGATVFANVTLHDDLICPGDALIVGADRITVDLNGHTIGGAGTGVGIMVAGRTDVSIRGGTVRDFASGVLVVDSTRIDIKESWFLRNGDGIDLQAGATRNTVKTSEFLDNRTRGIMLRTFSTENEIKENTFAGNRVGILLFGAVDTTVKDNLVANSVVAGIRINVVATGNDVKANTVSANPAGIEFLRAGLQTPTANTLVENTIVLNTCGIKGPTEGNTIKEQDFGGNGTDVCP